MFVLMFYCSMSHYVMKFVLILVHLDTCWLPVLIPLQEKKASPFKNENLLIWFYFVTIVIWAGVVSTQMMHLTVQMKFTASNKINSIFLKCCWELGSVYLLFYFRNLESWQSKICWLPLRYCIYATIST